VGLILSSKKMERIIGISIRLLKDRVIDNMREVLENKLSRGKITPQIDAEIA
jgi:hypothetical protein